MAILRTTSADAIKTNLPSRPRQFYDNYQSYGGGGGSGYPSYVQQPFVAPFQATSSYGANQAQPVVIIQPVVKAHKAKGWLKSIKK